MKASLLRTAAALAVLAGWNPPLFSSSGAGGTTTQWQSPRSLFGSRLIFEPNVGQAPAGVEYVARGPGYRLLLGGREAVFLLNRSAGGPVAVRLALVGARKPVRTEGLERLPSRTNYFLKGRRTALSAPHFTGARFHGVYAGIDLLFYDKGGELEFDFIVAPGADPGRIAWRYAGVERMTLDGGGGLVLETKAGNLRQMAPVAYQAEGGDRLPVECRYVIEGGVVRLSLGRYRPDLPLIIDPVVTYTTYVGGAGSDFVTGIAVDSNGYVYLTGYTRSASLPGLNGFQQFHGGLDDVFVAKLSPDGKSLVYVTFLGGSTWDYGRDIAVDSAGNIYVTGESWSAGYPLTLDSYRPFCCGVFVTKLDPAGAALVYSTFIGSGYAAALAVDASGRAYVGGWTDLQFPATPGAYQAAPQGMSDGFVVRLSADGSAIESATYLGGGGNDRILDIALGPGGSVHAAGFTESVNFPVTPGAVQPALGGLRDGFVLKLSAALDVLEYGSYLGGVGMDYAASVAVANTGRIYVSGATESPDFPVTAGAYQAFPSGSPPWGFVAAVDPAAAAFVYSTYFGQRIENGGIHLAVDGAGAAYLVGATTAEVFPTTPDAFLSSPAGGRDGFLAHLDTAGATLLFSTRFGGSQDDYVYAVALGPPGSVYLAGITRSPDLPTTPGAAQESLVGAADAFVVRMDGFPSPQCTYQLSPASASFPATGGTGEITITTDAACTWSATVFVPWITLTSPQSGTGGDTITYTVDPNPSPDPRSAVIQITGQTVAVTQSAGTLASPNPPAGPSLGIAGYSYSYSVADADETRFEYRFDWGDGRLSDWGAATATVSWPVPGDYQVRVQQRDLADPSAESVWSEPLAVAMYNHEDILTNEAFIAQLYWDILNRAPELAEQQSWVDSLNNQTDTRAGAGAALLETREYRYTGAFVIRCYMGILLRGPDMVGWVSWYNYLRNGGTPQDIANGFVRSAEFVSRYGSLNDAEFITLVYNNVLGRDPDPIGFDRWLYLLESGTITRAEMMVGFVNSAEYVTKTQNLVSAHSLFLAFYRRHSAGAEVAAWASFLETNDLKTAVARFISAEPYLSRFK